MCDRLLLQLPNDRFLDISHDELGHGSFICNLGAMRTGINPNAQAV